jgi:hypothetical protein
MGGDGEGETGVCWSSSQRRATGWWAYDGASEEGRWGKRQAASCGYGESLWCLCVAPGAREEFDPSTDLIHGGGDDPVVVGNRLLLFVLLFLKLLCPRFDLS